jgi:hypothetical protein
LRLGTAESREAPGAFAFDQCPDAFIDQRRSLGDAGQALRFGEQFIVQIDGCSHSQLSIS